MPNSFWSYQLKTSWRNLGNRPLLERVGAYLQFTREMLSRHHSATGSPMVGTGIPESEKLTVIVLNHKRPENVGQIAQYVLRAGFVGKLIISNNSQEYPIEKYIKAQDPRLSIRRNPPGRGSALSWHANIRRAITCGWMTISFCILHSCSGFTGTCGSLRIGRTASLARRLPRTRTPRRNGPLCIAETRTRRLRY